MLILGIETSCDEASAAVLEDGRRILSNVIYSQDEIHNRYGGVVPELASREHLRKIDSVVATALEQAGVGIREIDAYAVTRGPGLIGSLLIGISYAKALAYFRQKPLFGVNHLIGHIHAVFLEHEKPPLPFMALVVSGGHTSLVYSATDGSVSTIGKTRDDAAGEAFDKVAKMLGLGYPGGPKIEKMAREGRGSIRFSRVKISDGSLDFSFSGLKTAVLYHLRENPATEQTVPGICASFQRACVEALVEQTERALQQYPASAILLCGGVACNAKLREAMSHLARRHALPCLIPSPRLCADNGAMIAAASVACDPVSPLDLDGDPNLRIPAVAERKGTA
ncbi:MAG: tRNA (adenosine(37)-N6)-threonylcarbamoyltransferase complex transferase subunit TsaD [Acidobacteria bacterium]|nr:tRNA (adenosine(37)-N6)-threonylcarbamoyltransferase complex transferase subunit TsaD [Acidobacteriota bacterium]